MTAKVQLANLRQEVTRIDATLGSRFDEVRDQLRRASIELRDLARGVHPTALTEGGLASALRHAVASFPGDATVDIRTARRFDPEVERAVYFCLTEALAERLQARWRRDSHSARPGRRRIGTALHRQRRRSRIRSGGDLRRHRARQHGRSARRGGWGPHRQRLDRWWDDNLRRGADLPGSSCLPHLRTPASVTSRHVLAIWHVAVRSRSVVLSTDVVPGRRDVDPERRSGHERHCDLLASTPVRAATRVGRLDVGPAHRCRGVRGVHGRRWRGDLKDPGGPAAASRRSAPKGAMTRRSASGSGTARGSSRPSGRRRPRPRRLSGWLPTADR